MLVWGVGGVQWMLTHLVAPCVDSSWNVMAHGNAREGKWRGNWRMEWVSSTFHTTSELGVSSITTADAHNSAASSRLNLRSCRFKWTRPFRRKRKSGFLGVCHHISTGLYLHTSVSEERTGCILGVRVIGSTNQPQSQWRAEISVFIVGCYQRFPSSANVRIPLASALPTPADVFLASVNPLNAELNPICYLLALLGAHHFLHVSRISVKSLTFRLLMSYIYIWH